MVEGDDFIEVTPAAQLKHAAIDTYNDHRIAMCFSLVALSDTPVTINDPGCTSKTFPDYFDKLASIQSALTGARHDRRGLMASFFVSVGLVILMLVARRGAAASFPD